MVAAANIVHSCWLPRSFLNLKGEGDSKESVANGNANTQIPLIKEKLDKLFSKFNLSETKDWYEGKQKDVWDLITEFGFLFALEALELGGTSIVKHSIKFADETPFKENYRRVPPHQSEEVKNPYGKY